MADSSSQLSVELLGEPAMLAFAADLAAVLEQALAEQTRHGAVAQAAIIALQGNLGVGKTTLSRGILHGLGHSGAVKSPTYTLVELYQLALGTVCHFDFYRLMDPEELEYMGFRDYLVDARLCLIEWPERGRGFLPDPDITIDIIQAGEGRMLTLQAGSSAGGQILLALNQGYGQLK